MVPKGKYPKHKQSTPEVNHTINYQIPLPFDKLSSSKGIFTLLPFQKIFGRPFAKHIFWFVFTTFTIGALVFEMLPPELKTLLILGDVLLGFVIFFPTEKVYKAFKIDFQALPIKEQMTRKLSLLLFLCAILILRNYVLDARCGSGRIGSCDTNPKVSYSASELLLSRGRWI